MLDREPQLTNHLDRLGLWFISVRDLTIAWGGPRVQPTVGSTIPRQVGLGCVRKAIEQGSGGAHLSSLHLGSRGRWISHLGV